MAGNQPDVRIRLSAEGVQADLSQLLAELESMEQQSRRTKSQMLPVASSLFIPALEQTQFVITVCCSKS